MSSLEKNYILVVDDLPDNIFLLQTILESEGYVVDAAFSGTSALDKIEAGPPDLVLLDVMMPDMDGYEVTKHIRQNENLPFIPIVLITAYDEPSATQGFEVGANDFIRKPIDVDKLLVTVNEFLQSL